MKYHMKTKKMSNVDYSFFIIINAAVLYF